MRIFSCNYITSLLIKTKKFDSKILKIENCNDYRTLLLIFEDGFTLYNYDTDFKKEFNSKKNREYSLGAYIGDGKNFITVCSESLEFYGSK